MYTWNKRTKHLLGLAELEWWTTCFGFTLRWVSPPELFFEKFSVYSNCELPSRAVVILNWVVCKLRCSFPLLKAPHRKSMVSTRTWGVWSPSIPFSQSRFSSSGVIGSACFVWTPRSLERSCFTTPSSTFLKPANEGEGSPPVNGPGCIFVDHSK